MNQLELTLTIRPISKKNSSQIFVNRRTGARFVTSSEAYKRFEDEAILQIREQMYSVKDWDPTGYFDIQYTLYMKGKLDIDTDNFQASINDTLQKAGIIDNDKHIDTGSFVKHRGCEVWGVELVITKIDPVK